LDFVAGWKNPHPYGSFNLPPFSPAPLLMGYVLFAAPTPAARLLFCVGLIAFNISSRRFSAGKYRAPGAFRKVFLQR
jgi:hypothetical protein